MKTCSRCHISKPESDFYADRHRNGRPSSRCKECLRFLAKAHYDARTQDQIDHYNSMVRNRYHGIYIRDKSSLKMSPSDLRAMKSARGCLRCGETDHLALDFHHLGEKTSGISSGRGLSRSRLDTELSKCIILCSNCHRKLHGGSWVLSDIDTLISEKYPEAYEFFTKSSPPF